MRRVVARRVVERRSVVERRRAVVSVHTGHGSMLVLCAKIGRARRGMEQGKYG